jgi:putative transcriptional regulator
MKEGVMHTTAPDATTAQATGIALADAKVGEDLGLRDLHGKVNIKQGKIPIVKLPSMHRGGSRAVDLAKVKAYYDQFKPNWVGVMGAVGRAGL